MCLPERAQKTMANFKKMLIIKSNYLQAALLDCCLFLRGNLPEALFCFPLSSRLCRDTVAYPQVSLENSASPSLRTRIVKWREESIPILLRVTDSTNVHGAPMGARYWARHLEHNTEGPG